MKFTFLKINNILFVMFLLQFNFNGFAQTAPDNFPKVGDRCPGFIMNDLHYYSRKRATSTDFKGKPMILDFFSVGCKACFESFPKVNALKKEFEGKVDFFLIAKKSPGLQHQYEKYMNHYNLKLPVDYDDSIIWNQFGVLLVPYTIWIDSEGIIRQITTSFALTNERMNNFLKGQQQQLSLAVNQTTQNNEEKGIMFYNPNKPFLVEGNGGSDTAFSYRSIFCNWNPRSYFHRDLYISSKNKNRLDEIGVSLEILYNLAYGDTVMVVRPPLPEEVLSKTPNNYGKWARTPLVESSRKDLFDSDIDSAKNEFCYSLKVPDSLGNAVGLQKIMQRDLKNYFSFDVTVEKRKMPCWKIIANKNVCKQLITNGGDPVWNETFSSFTFRNQPISSLILEIWAFHQDEMVFIDETGIDYKIDLNMHCIMTDLKDIKRELQKNGLDLVKSEKEMKVIVIRDAREK